MPAADSIEERKLLSGLQVYLKVGEREFLAKNFKSALKNFKNVRLPRQNEN